MKYYSGTELCCVIGLVKPLRTTAVI